MNGRKSKRSNRNKNEKPKNIIRCHLNQRIVWDNELCSSFIKSGNYSSEKNCKNCKYSF
jgi:hypothetical protein